MCIILYICMHIMCVCMYVCKYASMYVGMTLLCLSYTQILLTTIIATLCDNVHLLESV